MNYQIAVSESATSKILGLIVECKSIENLIESSIKCLATYNLTEDVELKIRFQLNDLFSQQKAKVAEINQLKAQIKSQNTSIH